MGGSDDKQNLEAMTLPEHYLDHMIKARNAKDGKTAYKQENAARMIEKRMTEEERRIKDLLMQNLYP